MAIMNPSKLRGVLNLLPYCNLSDSKKRAIEAIITKYLNGEIVPVVRCKDCKRFSPCKEIEGMSWSGWCNYGEFHTDEDDFCSRGERKDS